MQIYRLATHTNIATSLRYTKVTAASVFHCRLLRCVLHFRRIHNMPISGFCDRKWKDYQLCVCVECTTENRRMTAVCSKRLVCINQKLLLSKLSTDSENRSSEDVNCTIKLQILSFIPAVERCVPPERVKTQIQGLDELFVCGDGRKTSATEIPQRTIVLVSDSNN